MRAPGEFEVTSLFRRFGVRDCQKYQNNHAKQINHTDSMFLVVLLPSLTF